MSGEMAYIRHAYNVPAKRGATVRYTDMGSLNGLVGKIKSARYGRLFVDFPNHGRKSVHPKSVSYLHSENHWHNPNGL